MSLALALRLPRALPAKFTPEQHEPAAAKVAAAPRVEATVLADLPSEDRTLARLAVAETASDECDLLGNIAPSEAEAATFAITDVLERTRFESVRACATEALAKQPTAPARSWLVDLATDPDPNVHRPALVALAQRDEAARIIVLEAAHSENADIAENAVVAAIATQEAAGFAAAGSLLQTAERPDMLSALVQALGSTRDPRALPLLSDLVGRADRDTHLAAIAALGELGEKKAEPLLESLLATGSTEELEAAARALAALDPERAAARLAPALHSQSAERRTLALSVMISSKLAGAELALSNALHGNDPALARTALSELGAKPDPALEPDIAPLLGDADSGVRNLALRALARMHTPRALADLGRWSDDPALGPRIATELERSAASEDERRARRIRNLERGQGGSLLALARDPDAAAQTAVFQHFSGATRDPAELAEVFEYAPADTVKRLSAQLDPQNDAERLALVSGLAERADPAFADPLRAATHDSDVSVQRAALNGLVRLGDDEAQRRFFELSRSSDTNDRSLAANSLATLDRRDAEPLLETLINDADPQVALRARNSLVQLDPTRAAEVALEQGQGAPNSAQVTATSGLGPEEARKILDLALASADDEVAQAAVSALVERQGVTSAMRLLELARDETRSESVRTAAADGVIALGGPLVAQNRHLLDSLRTPESDEVVVLSCGQ